MKKTILYIAIVLLLIIITASGTYAYLVAATNSTANAANTKGAVLDVIYTKGEDISGTLNLTKDKNGGLETTINIRLSDDSVQVSANLYINIEEITETIANSALNWEVYETVNNTEILVGSGTFADCGNGTACKTNDKLYIVNNYELSTTNTTFTVYIWLNGNAVGNEVLNAVFKGKIGAESGNFTGELK